jgi:ABC-type bacteriocin/lantibiotic exporter with double-glycine peptidase domain|tara:strand:+ start:145 stop:1803 length:1659 start_codon:yes stop_codon:yes gene_type:complete
MKLVTHLFKEYVQEEKFNISVLLISSLAVNILQANAVSHFNAKIVDAIQHNKIDDVLLFFKYFMLVWVAYVAVYHIYRIYQDAFSAKLRQWGRYKMIQYTLEVNNENLSNINFTKISNPINRVSTSLFLMSNQLLSYVIPNFSFIAVSIIYFLYCNTKLGCMFLFGNLIWGSIIWLLWKSFREKSREYEQFAVDTEMQLVEVLNNMDKVITRGQIPNENDGFIKLKDATIDSANRFYASVSNTLTLVSSIVLVTLFACVGYAIKLYMKKQISITIFITIFTLLILFRERITNASIQLVDIIELLGRIDALKPYFEDIENNIDTLGIQSNKLRTDVSFEHFEFKNVSFQYTEETPVILDNANITIETADNNIIGIVGSSGNGKSTITKLMIKLYTVNSGTLFVDGVDINTVDTAYIRDNITYVNQSSTLFDDTVIKNVLYGCNEETECKKYYEHIMTYPKIKELYQDVDLNEEAVGYSGEKLSGGQRQIANIIGGLINPSKILILDEPTNALDGELKKELLGIIKYFKQHKQAIIIVSHDKEVFPMFDTKIEV